MMMKTVAEKAMVEAEPQMSSENLSGVGNNTEAINRSLQRLRNRRSGMKRTLPFLGCED